MLTDTKIKKVSDALLRLVGSEGPTSKEAFHQICEKPTNPIEPFNTICSSYKAKKNTTNSPHNALEC